MNRFRSFLHLLLCIATCQLAGILGTAFTADAIPTWYAVLKKPPLQPPNWLFGPVWTVLYALMGISAFLIWQKGWRRPAVKKALLLFVLQLVLNFFWTLIFFGLRQPAWALGEIILLWLSIVWTIYLFHPLSKKAAYLLVPYLLWVSFAAYLNGGIMILN